MTSKQAPSQRSFSLPLTWLLVVGGLTVLLVYRFGWWWLEQSATGGCLYDIVPDFKTRYPPPQQERITKAIEVAISDRDIDFSQVLPDIPFSNADIREHPARTLERLKKLD